MLGDLYYGALRGLGITRLARHLSHGALVLCYHNVVSPASGEPSFGDPGLHLAVDRFTRQMQWLKEHYTVVPLRELVARLEIGKPVRGLAALTFDDGYAGALTIAWPILRKLGLPATTFIVAEAPDRSTPFWWDHRAVIEADTPATRAHRLLMQGGDYRLIMTNTEANTTHLPETYLPSDWSVVKREANAGLDVGAHTLTHRTMTCLSDHDLRREVEESGDVIEERTGVRPDAFSYPYGIWDARVRDAVQHAGYRAAVTLEFGLNKRGTDPLALRRVNVPASISFAAFASWAAGMRPPHSTAA